jgi:glycosyltransferase involved in cell wall biosynthesis
MAAGRPAVASAVGASNSIVEPGETGFLANSMDEWVAALAGLAADRNRAQRMGLAARRRAEAKYSLELSAARLAAVLLDALLEHARARSDG